MPLPAPQGGTLPTPLSEYATAATPTTGTPSGLALTSTSTMSSTVLLKPDLYEDGTLDPVYEAKIRLLNREIQDIGMGRYQYALGIVAGFGWFADSVWPLITGLILTPVLLEYPTYASTGALLSLAANIGLLVGAVFWGLGCDIWGRKVAFNVTLLIAGVFGLAAGGAPGGARGFGVLAGLLAANGVGVGGNLPVDSAVFLDLVPASHQYLLTSMAVWWCLGQLFISLIAWPLISRFSCAAPGPDVPPCTRQGNMGWRYLLFALGGLTLLLWGLRFFVFELLESPRYLVGVGRDEEAVKVIGRLREINTRRGKKGEGREEEGGEQEQKQKQKQKRDSQKGGELEKEKEEGRVEGGQMELRSGSANIELTVQMLKEIEQRYRGDGDGEERDGNKDRKTMFGLSKTSIFAVQHIKALFRTRRMALSTGLLIAIWSIIGLASTLYNNFLPYLLAKRGVQFGDATLDIVYRNQFILSVIGVPATLFAGWAVEVSWLGRRGVLAWTAALTGVFLFASTTAQSSNALLGWNCGYAFGSNMMYGVLYAISAEIFPAKDRGTGNGLVSTAQRVFGVIGPVIALYANITTSVPVYISGALIMSAGGLALLLPYEPRGHASM